MDGKERTEKEKFAPEVRTNMGGANLETIEYVVGFALNQTKRMVLLIQKRKPAWQRGKLNGIGGKVEPGEIDIKAMVREFEEETGISTRAEDWKRFNLDFDESYKWIVTYFFAVLPDDQFFSFRQTECEKPIVVPLNILHFRNTVSNINQLISTIPVLKSETKEEEMPNHKEILDGSNNEPYRQITRAIGYAGLYGAGKGEKHKTWVIDQMVRALTDDGYEDFLRNFSLQHRMKWNEGEQWGEDEFEEMKCAMMEVAELVAWDLPPHPDGIAKRTGELLQKKDTRIWELEEALGNVEWSEFNHSLKYGWANHCPKCKGCELEGHASGCTTGKALGRV